MRTFWYELKPLIALLCVAGSLLYVLALQHRFYQNQLSVRDTQFLRLEQAILQINATLRTSGYVLPPANATVTPR